MVKLLHTLHPKNGHVNGMRYFVDPIIILQFATGNRKFKRLILPGVLFDPGDKWFPIPGFTETSFALHFFCDQTNKPQVLSFSGALGIYLRHKCFTHGQQYVSNARITHPYNISVYSQGNDQATTNIVFNSDMFTK